jgi:HCOMODA/2-hydroxy-3-carboxy-muconic semialdehyde decarboxylase
MSDDSEAMADLVIAYKILVNEQVLDSFGHISIRSQADPTRFMMPRAMPPSLVEVADILELNVDTSQPIDARGRRTNGERYLHGEIYRARPDVMAIVHSHSPAVIPLTIAEIPMKPVIVQAGFLSLEVPNFEIRHVRGDGRGMQITDAARGAALAHCLGQGAVALLRGHGNVVVGTSVRQATVFAVYTDINAQMQMQAMQLNRDIVALDGPELFGPDEFDINRPWEHFRQKLLTESARAKVDRSQFGLDHTQ